MRSPPAAARPREAWPLPLPAPARARRNGRTPRDASKPPPAPVPHPHAPPPPPLMGSLRDCMRQKHTHARPVTSLPLNPPHVSTAAHTAQVTDRKQPQPARARQGTPPACRTATARPETDQPCGVRRRMPGPSDAPNNRIGWAFAKGAISREMPLAQHERALRAPPLCYSATAPAAKVFPRNQQPAKFAADRARQPNGPQPTTAKTRDGPTAAAASHSRTVRQVPLTRDQAASGALRPVEQLRFSVSASQALPLDLERRAPVARHGRLKRGSHCPLQHERYGAAGLWGSLLGARRDGRRASPRRRRLRRRERLPQAAGVALRPGEAHQHHLVGRAGPSRGRRLRLRRLSRMVSEPRAFNRVAAASSALQPRCCALAGRQSHFARRGNGALLQAGGDAVGLPPECSVVVAACMHVCVGGGGGGD